MALCYAKKGYTKRIAQERLNSQRLSGNIDSGRIYECPGCGWWHLTSQPMENRSEKPLHLQHIEKWNDLLNNEKG